jgi:hypothetical protein
VYSAYAGLQTVQGGSPLAFPTTSAQVGTDVGTDGLNFRVGTAGVYRVFYSLTVDPSSASGGSVSLALNATPRGPARTIAPGAAGVQAVSDTVIFTAAPGDGFNLVASSTGSASFSAASIVVERIR